MTGSPSLPASRQLKMRSKSAAACCSPLNWRSGRLRMARAALPLNFVVVGGGPTGVELAGTLAEIATTRVGPRIPLDRSGAHTHSAGRGRAAHSSRVLRKICRAARRNNSHHLGVEVRTSTTVTQIEPGAVYVGDTRLPATVVLWAAGVAASPLGKKLGAPGRSCRTRAGAAGFEHSRTSRSFRHRRSRRVKGRAWQNASRRGPGRNPARPLRRQSDSRRKLESPRRAVPARVPLLGQGQPGHDRPCRSGRANLASIHISGFIAWLSWLFVHILFLIGFRNRLLVFIQWAWSYVTYERGARLDHRQHLSARMDACPAARNSTKPAAGKKFTPARREIEGQ